MISVFSIVMGAASVLITAFLWYAYYWAFSESSAIQKLNHRNKKVEEIKREVSKTFALPQNQKN